MALSASHENERKIELFNSTHTVTATLASDPDDQTPGQIVKRLFSRHGGFARGHGHHRSLSSSSSKTLLKNASQEPEQDDLDTANVCGRFDKRPSILFLKMFSKVLTVVEDDPAGALVSPSLLGCMGSIPSTIVSVIPDILRHYANVIVAAQHEVILATNYWEASSSAAIITNAFRELSRRAGARGERVVVKMMYDRGSPKQILDSRQFVSEETYTGASVKIPPKVEVPHLDFELINYHEVLLGTFHAKYLVVDRRIALVNSNNIQDRCNLEMMTHLEGPIVDAFYDMALISWDKRMEPPLRCLAGVQAPWVEKIKKQRSASESSSRSSASSDLSCVSENGTTYDEDIHAEKERLMTGIGSHKAGLTKHLSTNLTPDFVGDAEMVAGGSLYEPIIIHPERPMVPMAMVNRTPSGSAFASHLIGNSDLDCPQNAAWLAGMHFAKEEIFIQTPTFNAAPAVDAILAACRRGVKCVIYADIGFNDEGERLPLQGGTNEMVVERMYKELEEEYKENLCWYWYTAKDMTRPLNASKKTRNCHIKVMIIDGQVGIQGNGNQDSQSWFHSQEINIMVDSSDIMREWRAGIEANQNTVKHGRVQLDAVWRDENGGTLPDSAMEGGPFRIVKGLIGAVRRAQGSSSGIPEVDFAG